MTVDRRRISVAVEAPQYSGLDSLLDYLAAGSVAPGSFLRVPLGRRTLLGVAWEGAEGDSSLDESALKPVAEVLDAVPPLTGSWRALANFAARYYQRNVGELVAAVLPPEFRKLDAASLAKRVEKLLKSKASSKKATSTRRSSAGADAQPEEPPAGIAADTESPERASALLPELSEGQTAALAAIRDVAAQEQGGTVLLHGVTGSGKTEVYLRAVADALDRGRQALVMVPEINLTPQLEERFNSRFAGRRIVSLHSGLTPIQRLNNWLLAHLGEADLVLGTRLAIFASMPRLGLIVVDEEHDPSYKQQEGARYSARDLAVYRGHLERLPVILGSATPSLESWQRGLEGRYRRVTMAERIGGGAMPRLRVVDMTQLPRMRGSQQAALSPPLVAALQQRMARGEQSLIFLNRRGYAPVLACDACGWKSGCPNCSAWRVFHKRDRSLRCHHCGFAEAVPKACPDCGNLDIAPVGRGTERLEEQLAQLLPEARIARIDADSTRTKGALEAQLGAVHAGDVDILVGTQMVTKGHDFRRITLVAAVNPDGALFTSDFRAPERLFALLMQAAGRAGRDAEAAERSEMWVQTWNPAHPLYAALKREDYAGFAESQLRDRQSANMPPFSHLALVRAEARTPEAARAFLDEAAVRLQSLPGAADVFVYAAVPTAIARVANVERMQMLVESSSRAVLQALLSQWVTHLHELRSAHRGVLRWAVDVDPLIV